MITDELFRKVLMEPVCSSGANKLLAVSGYATASMADKHLKILSDLGSKAEINLIVGMPRKDGIEKVQHNAFQKLSEQGSYGNTVSCDYIVRGNPVHAKTYLWLKDEMPIVAFSGSANYTNTGFGKTQIEAMSEVDPVKAHDLYKVCLRNSESCDAIDIETMIAVTETRSFNDSPQIEPDGEFVTLSLLLRNGETPERSGLNWGQRDGRNRNQAYIPVPVSVQRTDFFPERGEQFTVLTDDGDSFIFVRVQENGKALHTTEDNSQLGEYIRSRIGVKSGEYVTRQHLSQYGRTDVTFTKIEEETYLMDFRPNFGPGEDAENWQE